MRILFENKAKSENATIESIYPVNNYSPRNIVDAFLERRYQSSRTVDTMTITFKTGISVNSVFWGFHNLSRMEFTGFDKAMATVWEHDIDNPSAYGSVYFDIADKFHSFTIQVFAKTGEATAYLGGVGIGNAYRMPDPIANWGLGNVDNSISVGNEAGQMLNSYIEPLRSETFNFENVTLQQTNEIIDLYRSVGVGGKIWVDAFEGTDEIMPVCYCQITDPVQAKKNGRRFEFKLKTIEAR